jgi:hypothetical protein
MSSIRRLQSITRMSAELRTQLLRLVRILVVVTFLLSLATAGPVLAGPPNGVDHLRGRWDGIIEDLHGTDQPFTLQLDDFEPDPNDPAAALAGGCLSVGEDAMSTPLSARAVDMGDESFDITIFGTVASGGEAFIIKLTGFVETLGPGVPDDSADGGWVTAEAEGNWSANHHDRRRPKCPVIQVGDGLVFSADVYAGVNVNPGGIENVSTLLESFTNIVSSAVQVELPDGSSQSLPLFTDLFSPQVDFINEFRFLGNLDGFPKVGGTYTFTLLDVQGQPIAGATTSDTWLACTVDAARNVSAAVEAGDGILVGWDPVDPAPGFDPQGSPSLGFYQIELGPDNGGDGGYGASSIHQASHLIPLEGFGGAALGSPDGFDFGNALEELSDGSYGFDVIAFAEAPPSSVASGLECQIRASDERVRFEKSGDAFTILP